MQHRVTPTVRSDVLSVGYPEASDRPLLSIIVPAFEEAPNLSPLTHEIAAALEAVIPTWELIIVDDDSQDGTVDICRALQAEGFPLRLVVRHHARGLSSAVVAGLAHAKAPILLVMDADLSHPACTIPLLYAAVRDGAEFAIGSRYVPGGGTDDRWSTYRWLNSKVASWLAMPLVSLRDPTAGFFAFPRSLLRRCEGLNPIGYKIALEILIKSRARHIQELPIQFRTRQFGKSKLKLKQQLLYLRHLASLYRFKFFHRAQPGRQTSGSPFNAVGLEKAELTEGTFMAVRSTRQTSAGVSVPEQSRQPVDHQENVTS